MWEGPFWESVWPASSIKADCWLWPSGLSTLAKDVGHTDVGRYLDPWDSVRLRTASTHWNVPGKYWPHGELFFYLVKKEPVVASNDVSSNPFCLCGNAQGVCADWPAPIGSRR